jgi:hypothetical protein
MFGSRAKCCAGGSEYDRPALDRSIECLVNISERTEQSRVEVIMWGAPNLYERDVALHFESNVWMLIADLHLSSSDGR